MKSFLFLVTFGLLFNTSELRGQVANFNDFGAKPVNASRYSKDIQGSPFLSPSFQIGDIIMEKRVVGGQQIMYDTYTDELLVKNAENLMIINSLSIKGFVINIIDETNDNIRYTFKNGFKNVDKYSESAYFCIYFETDKVKVIGKKYTDKSEFASAYGTTVTSTVFSSYEKFFVIENSIVIPFKKGKGLLKALKDDGKLKKYAQINKIDISTPVGIVKIMNQYLAR